VASLFDGLENIHRARCGRQVEISVDELARAMRVFTTKASGPPGSVATYGRTRVVCAARLATQLRTMTQPLAVTFAAGAGGDWRIERLAAVTGQSLPAAPRLSMASDTARTGETAWRLRGIVSHVRYTPRPTS
jgi:hypothetical protein